MTYPIRQPPDGDTAWGNDVRATIAGVNDHQNRVTSLEGSAATVPSVTYTTSGTLALTDAGKVVEMNSASATTVTIPANSSVAYLTGTIIDVYRYGAGSVTLAGATGVTLRPPAGSPLTLRAQYSTVSLRKRATDEWAVSGDLG